MTRISNSENKSSFVVSFYILKVKCCIAHVRRMCFRCLSPISRQFPMSASPGNARKPLVNQKHNKSTSPFNKKPITA